MLNELRNLQDLEMLIGPACTVALFYSDSFLEREMMLGKWGERVG